MRASDIVTAHEVRAVRRDKTFVLLLVVFLGMTLASAYIGWSSHHTVQSVYDSSALLLQQQGKAVPPPPFDSVAPLSLANNMIVYVVLIGALLALTLGQLAGLRDRQAGVVRILFSRPVTAGQFLTGKVQAIVLVLGCVLGLAWIVSVASSIVVSHIGIADAARLAGFYLLSLAYLTAFALLGLLFGLTAESGTMALLMPTLIWMAITFLLPELGSALHPTASLNPTLPQTDVLESSMLHALHSAVYPLSLSEQFKAAAEGLLMLPTQSPSATGHQLPAWLGYITVPAWAAACMASCHNAMAHFKPWQNRLDDE